MSLEQDNRPRAVILNVNDTEGTRYMVTLMLKKAGFDVLEAGSGEAALEQIARHHPDLVVLDVKLPGISGLEVCRRVRDAPSGRPIKILHTSATYVAVEAKVQSLENGADGYLMQPFEPEELVATVRSLLRLNHAEQELRGKADQLRESDRRKDEFLAMLAHELRNPLAAITTALPLIERRDPFDDIEQRARRVLHRQVRHLGRLVDDLLDVARVTQGKIELHRETVELDRLLRRVASNAEQTNARPRRQALHVELPATRVVVRGDATRLEQIFTNLLDNASKYTDPGGTVHVSLCVIDDGPGQTVARVVVRDEGIGMSGETLPTIFDLFVQADVPISRSRGGLGIGLTLVRTLVQLHGGTVVARSAGIGAGSELQVDLPAVVDVEVPATAADDEASGPASGATVSQKVLVIEDRPDVQEMLKELIEAWGHEVVCASEGVSGVASALALRPDVAFVDIGLPGIDGYEVARRVRSDPRGKELVLVAITGYGSPEQKTKALAAGFDIHLVKPVDAKQLAAVLAGE
jgi:two-component system, sensor histidine kinase